MSDSARIDAAADRFSLIPIRWSARLLAPGKADPPAPSVGEIEAGFAAVQAVLSALGPPASDEETPHQGYRESRAWTSFDERWPDLRTLNARDVDVYLSSPQFESSISTAPANANANAPGMIQGWLREQMGLLAQSILLEIPTFYEDDPEDLRETAFRCFQGAVFLLPDHSQAVCLGLVLDQVEMRAFGLARRLYHHPNAGPRMKAAVDELFTEEYAAKLKSDPPETHEDPPWK